MNIKVFGPGCAKCEEVATTVKNLVKEHKLNATIEKVSDIKEMMRFSVFATPAVAIDDVVKCVGRAPTNTELMEWLAIH